MSAWLFYALLAPLLFGVSNIFDKFLREKHLGTFTLSIFSGLSFFWAIALLPFVSFDSSPLVIFVSLIAGVTFFLNAFPYFQALAIEEASRVIPLWALEAPLTLILVFIFLKERLTFNDYVGFALVVCGAFLVSARKLGEVLRPTKAFLLMFAAASVTSVGIVMTKWAYSELSFWAVEALIFLGGGVAALFTFLLFRKARVQFLTQMLSLRKALALKLGIRQALLISGFLTFGFAIMTGSASLSAALVQLAALYVFIIAMFLSRFLPHILEEEIDKKALLTKAVAILMIIAGVFVINL